ncbi:uncharacterized protein LOC115440698 [Manduca sexta]|uniref:Spaetzle domain-containing protein n=1 Tax=Manduca sexta TaxID=7130 RepID=A0A922CHI3_MANSE|nr:uncharacterized protein LOC115440698 [Manduca sexta]KAG6445803.1 hypothetical protein O3G_MSEX004104 [Manduca sexta]
MASVTLMFTVVLVALSRSAVTASKLDIPPECKDKMFCDVEPAFYNEYREDIELKFKPIKSMWNLADNYNYDYQAREYTFENNCNYVKEMSTPYLVHSNGTAKIIVQTSFYKQRFMTTRCVDSFSNAADGEQCFKGILSGNSRGSCKTKYTNIILYAYDEANKRIQRLPIEVPVCCYCGITSEFD